MALNSKLIGGLAWTGLVLVLAVPGADIVSSQLSPKSSLAMTSDTDQVQTASIADPVEAFESTGKPLPSYISDVPATAKPSVKVLPPSGSTAQPPVPGNVPSVSVAPMPETDVAAIDPVAPIPAPANLRPKAPVVTDPVVTGSVPVAPIVEEQVAAVPPVKRPPARMEEPRYVTEDELAGWDSGTLADYLDRQGLMSDASYTESSTAEYDADGFFLDEGPNGREIRSRSRRNFDDGFFLVFPD